MNCRYIALIGSVERRAGPDNLDVETSLLKLGLRHRLTLGSIRLFASEDTPALPVPGGGMVIGHLFSRDGATIHSDLPSSIRVREHLLEKTWGEYLLFQPATNGDGSITIMRDPSCSGGLACIYSLQSGSGFITSDISLATSLSIYRRRIDWDATAHFLMHPNKMRRRTTLADVVELLPGCALRLHGKDVIETTEWSPWDFLTPERRHVDPDEAAMELRTAVASSVKAFANGHDSVLMEISGGLDSSIVAECLRETRTHVICCTLETPVPGANEQSYAKLMADRLGAELAVEHLAFDKARFEFALPCHSINPRIGPLQYAIDAVMEAAADRHGVSAYFSGGGGDTVFGYIKTAAPAADAFKAVGIAAGLAAVRDLSEMHQCTVWKAGQLALKKLFKTPKAPAQADASFLHTSALVDSPLDHPWLDAPAGTLPGNRERVFDLAGNQAFRDSLARGLNRPLYMPLLAQPVVEACLRIPTWMWIAGGQNRAVARAAFANGLPPDVLNRRSKGTFMSYLGALYQKRKVEIQDYLTTGHLEAHGLLDADAVRRFVARQLPPRDHSFIRLFELCRVENWVRHQE